MTFAPRFSITHPITAALMRIERARGFLEAAKLSEDWIRRMGARSSWKHTIRRTSRARGSPSISPSGSGRASGSRRPTLTTRGSC